MAKSTPRGSKGGRPRDPIPRVPLSLRVTPEVRLRLEDLATTSGRSISQEAELRLEQAFRREDLLPDVLKLAYEDRLAGLLLAVGETIKMLGPLRLTSAQRNVDGTTSVTIGKWDADDRARSEASKAAGKLLDLLANPDQIEDFEKKVEEGIQEVEERPYTAVKLALMALNGQASYANDKRWQTIRALLGPPFSEAK